MTKKQLSEHQLFLKRLKKDNSVVIGGRIAVLIFLLGFWELFTQVGLIDPFIASSPSRIIDTLIDLVHEGNFFRHTFITLYETILAFSISMILGLISAIILFSFEKVRKISEPYLVVLNSLPKIALGPLIIVWVGAGTKAIVLMGFLICIVITIVSLLNSFIGVNPNKILLMKTLGANRFQILTQLILPQCFPEIISVLKINVGMSWVGIIMGEYLVSKEGLGYLIVYGGYIFKLDLVMTAIFILCILASLMYFGVATIEKHIYKKRK